MIDISLVLPKWLVIFHKQIFGRLLAPDSPGAWKELDPSQWLAFNGVSGLNIAGPGRINGRGKAWWDQSCRDHPRLVRTFPNFTLKINKIHLLILILLCKLIGSAVSLSDIVCCCQMPTFQVGCSTLAPTVSNNNILMA